MDKSKIKVIAILFSLVLVAGIVYYNIPSKSDKTINTADADWTEHFEDFSSLKENSDLIIKGKKVDSYTEQRVDLVFTKEIIEVNKVYSGEIKEGSKIEILQTGGTLNDIVTEPIEEAPILDKGGNYLLFLKSTPEGHYLILGGYQGVGLIKDNKIKFNKHNEKISNELKDKSLKDIENILVNR
jgi:hypothetical protein